MAYNMFRAGDILIIIETSIFTRQVLAMLSEEEYRRLQMALVLHPDMGAVIKGSGGLRKARWSVEGRGKRGGVRVIYYWAIIHDKILLLYLYAKNEQDDLTPDQLKALRRIIEEEY
jgi:mRNA-degrading endonuclease RelE of RelBE toxin-antitoxin system